MVALKLEGAIVVEEPAESAGERDCRSRQREHVMGPRFQGLRVSAGFACAVMIMTGTRASGPELGRLMVLTSAGPFRGCITSAAMTRSGAAVAIVPMAPVGLS